MRKASLTSTPRTARPWSTWAPRPRRLREASAEAIVKLPPAVARELAAHRASHEEGPGVRHRHRRGRHGREEDARDRSRSAIRCRSNAARVDIADRARRHDPHRLQRRRAPQDRRRDGSAGRRHRRGAHHLRHVQGAVARHRDRPGAPARARPAASAIFARKARAQTRAQSRA